MEWQTKREKIRIIALVLLGIIGVSIIFFRQSIGGPNDLFKDLEVMALNEDTEPVFYITSQLNYENVNEQGFGQNQYEELNLVYNLQSLALEDTEFISKMDALSKTFNRLTVSLLPKEGMTDDSYLAVYEHIQVLLEANNLEDIVLVAYPPTLSSLRLYEGEEVEAIGSVIKDQEDLKSVEKLYDYFLFKKPLFIRDEIKMSYGSNVSAAREDIMATYYLLAIQFPGVHTIFSPCITPNFIFQDSYVLDPKEEHFVTYQTIYARLLDKPWLSTFPKEVSHTSPYYTVEEEDLLTEKSEIILAPDTEVVEELEKVKQSDIYFKCNEIPLNINLYYPYAMTIDPIKFPNGLSRLKVVVEGKAGREQYATDLSLHHTLQKEKAKRKNSLQVIEEKTSISKTYIPILMYHTVEETVLEENENSCVTTERFEEQMKGLLDNGYTPINFANLRDYKEGRVKLPDKPVIITMDDGYLNNYTNAYPIYKKYGIQATLFVSPYYMEEEDTERHFGWRAAQEMEESGLIDIQPHGYDHTPLSYLSTEDIRYHVSRATGLIEEHLGKRDVLVLAYPQFRHNKRTVEVLDEMNFDFQITNVIEPNRFITSRAQFTPPLLKRINVPNTMTAEELIQVLEKTSSN